MMPFDHIFSRKPRDKECDDLLLRAADVEISDKQSCRNSHDGLNFYAWKCILRPDKSDWTPAEIHVYRSCGERVAVDEAGRTLQLETEYHRPFKQQKEHDDRLDIILMQKSLLLYHQEDEAEKRTSKLLRVLTAEELKQVKEYLDDASTYEPVYGSDRVSRSSVFRFGRGVWFNDEIIHCYLAILAQRDERLVREEKRLRRSHFVKSFFMTKLMNEGDKHKDGMYEYANVRHWSENAPGGNIFALDKIFFVVNEGCSHWVVVVVFMRLRIIKCLDSYRDAGMHHMQVIFQYLKDEHLDKRKTPLPDKHAWELIDYTLDVPLQLDSGSDCGVFTCLFCDFLSLDQPLLFTQAHVKECRELICLGILTGQAVG